MEKTRTISKTEATILADAIYGIVEDAYHAGARRKPFGIKRADFIGLIKVNTTPVEVVA